MAALNTSNLSRVTLVKSQAYKRDGLKSYAHLLQKYDIRPTVEGPYSRANETDQSSLRLFARKLRVYFGGAPSVRAAGLRKQTGAGKTGKVPAEDVQRDSEYLAEVSIGSPAQTLKLDFDTGSADLWVWSTGLSKSLQSQGRKSGHAIFDPSKSSSWKAASGQTWKIQYGDGSTASGNVGNDTLTIGGLKVKNQGVELAKQLSSQFAQGAGDGLLGLAWGNINTVQPNPVKTPVENMIAQDDIPKTAELFTANLGSWRDANDADKGVSFYTFGYIDQDVVSASGQAINYVDVDNSQGFWQFASSSVCINGQTTSRGGNTAIADTGTTLALVDDQTCKAIYTAIPGARQDQQVQGWVFPSSTKAAQLPDVRFAVGDKLFKVQKEDLSFADAGNGMVYGGIQSRGDLNFDILGDTFLKSIYAIFDQGNKRFGCVQRIEPMQNLTPPPAEDEDSL